MRVLAVLLVTYCFILYAHHAVAIPTLNLVKTFIMFSSFHLQVIMATNRHDTLDPALLRPGRLDRKIEFPMPDRRQKRLIFSTICTNMNLSDEVDLEDCILENCEVGWLL